MQTGNLIKNIQRTLLFGASVSLLGGCSKPDNLELKNSFPFAVQLRSRSRIRNTERLYLYPLVRAGEQNILQGAAWRWYENFDDLEVLDGQGKMIGKLNSFCLTKKSLHNRGCGGNGAIWHVTIGKKPIPEAKKASRPPSHTPQK